MGTGWKKRAKRLVLASMAMAALMVLASCGAKDAAVQEKAPDREELLIGMSLDSFVIERWSRDRDVFVSTARSLGAEVNVQSANGDVEEQIEQIRYLMGKNIDVLVVLPVDCDALSEVLQEARAKGVRVISYDRLAAKSGVDLYISFDNEEVGRLMARALAGALPENGKIFMIGGPLTDDNVQKVEKGFHEVIDGTGLEIVYQARCENWNAVDGYAYVKEGLAGHRDVDGIMCGNDDVATQAFRALAEERLAGKVMLTGQDGDLSACQRVVAGTQLVTVFKSVDEEARLAAEWAVKLGRGEEPGEELKAIYDGARNVPYLELTPIAVTKENIDEVVIEGGYHARDEVYLNR